MTTRQVDLRKREDTSMNPYGQSQFGKRPCSICGDDEPHHVHHNGVRVDDFFTVGRGQSDFEAALSWQRKYLALSRASDERQP